MIEIVTYSLQKRWISAAKSERENYESGGSSRGRAGIRDSEQIGLIGRDKNRKENLIKWLVYKYPNLG
jgi:hypothetical protein